MLLVNEYIYTEHKSTKKKKKSASQTEKRECRLYFAIFSESSKVEIKAYGLEICYLSGVSFFITIHYNSLSKLFVSSTL